MWTAKLAEQAARMMARNTASVASVASNSGGVVKARPSRTRPPRPPRPPRPAKPIPPIVAIMVSEFGSPESDPNRKPLGRGSVPRIDPVVGNYPICPYCKPATPETTIRAGKAHNFQRYRCVDCRRTYGGPSIIVTVRPRTFRLVCHHCGSDSTLRQGVGQSRKLGQRGKCNSCGLYFVQGGKGDLELYHLLLASRIADLKLPADVESELYQQSALDVLDGKGYCWTVELDTKQAWKTARGEYNKFGTDSYAMRLAGVGGASPLPDRD